MKTLVHDLGCMATLVHDLGNGGERGGGGRGSGKGIFTLTKSQPDRDPFVLLHTVLLVCCSSNRRCPQYHSWIVLLACCSSRYPDAFCALVNHHGGWRWRNLWRILQASERNYREFLGKFILFNQRLHVPSLVMQCKLEAN